MVIHAYAAQDPEAAPEPFEIEPGPLPPTHVEIAVEVCGLCHSDVHILRNHWRNTEYPVVCGHEAVGEIVALGDAVEGSSVGDRVGVGWQNGACLRCEACLNGDENLCDESRATARRQEGGFANRMRADHRFVHPIPDALSSAGAAPLLCAGATVFSPLEVYDVRPSMRVGVIGIGGLGHLAIRFAHAWGCEVTAFSTSPDKEDEARRLGADRFVVTRDESALKPLRGTLDFIVSTIHANVDFTPYVMALRPHGTLCFVGAPSEPITLHAGLLLGRSRRLAGSLIAPRARMRRMLEFAARHGIEAEVETMPMEAIGDALARLEANRARYRIVLRP